MHEYATAPRCQQPRPEPPRHPHPRPERGRADVVAGSPNTGDGGGLGALLARAVEQRARCRSPMIQRLVGFEVELSVPMFHKRRERLDLGEGPGGAVAKRLVGDWLAGGVDREKQGAIHVENLGDIELAGDHNRVTDTGRGVYNALRTHKSSQAQTPLVPFDGYVPMSILEYQTPAMHELAPRSNRRFKKLANAIEAHAQKLFDRDPRKHTSAVPGTRLLAGTPLKALKKWLGDPLPEWLRAPLKAYQEAVEWKMYVQATAGVLPTGLATLYESRSEDRPPGLRAPYVDASRAVLEGVGSLFGDDTFRRMAGKWLPSRKNKHGPVAVKALRGQLMVALSYIIGSALNQTSFLSDSMKNAVPLLVKMSDISAVAEAGPKWLRRNPPSKALIAYIAKYFHDNVPQTNLAYWLDRYELSLAHGDQRAAIIEGDPGGIDSDVVEHSTKLLKRALTGKGGADTRAGPGTPLPDLDPVPKATDKWKKIPAKGQHGLPVEYRWLAHYPSKPGELWPVFKRVLNEIREANLRTVPKKQREAIRKSWRK